MARAWRRRSRKRERVPVAREHLTTVEDETNLSDFTNVSARSCQQIFFGLKKVRSVMVTNMTTSGQHGNDPWKFVDIALRATPGIGSIEAYYFYMRTCLSAQMPRRCLINHEREGCGVETEGCGVEKVLAVCGSSQRPESFARERTQ